MSRISFEVEPEIHRKVRMMAAAKGVTIRQLMLEALEEHLKQEVNHRDTEEVFGISLPILERDWDNDLDAEYDELG